MTKPLRFPLSVKKPEVDHFFLGGGFSYQKILHVLNRFIFFENAPTGSKLVMQTSLVEKRNMLYKMNNKILM